MTVKGERSKPIKTSRGSKFKPWSAGLVWGFVVRGCIFITSEDLP